MDKEQYRKYDRDWKRQDRAKNPEKVRAKARAKYKELQKNPEWVEKHKAYMKAYQKEWEKNNPRLLYKREYMRKWHKKNQKKIYSQRRARPYEKLAASMRTRVYQSLKFGWKSAKTEDLIGITFPALKIYLEERFKSGMAWENYGTWHIDHRLPLSSFDLTKAEEQKKAFHYTNLQPLWAEENLRKHAKVL